MAKMKNRLFRTIYIEGIFLSPVHIGWGKELDPFSSFLKGDRLYYFNLSKVLDRFSIDERKAFVDLLDKNNLIEIRKFLFTRFENALDVALGNIRVASPIAKEYSKKIYDFRNQLIFEPFFRNSQTMLPILPGSSIKGAIRTAVIDTLIREEKIRLNNDQKKEPRKMEARVLGYRAMEQDPFKAFKVEDVNLENESTIIYKIFNYSLKRRKLADMGMRFETVRSHFEGTSVSFITRLTFFNGFKEKNIKIGNKASPSISRQLDPDFIIKACKQFYIKNLKEEHDRFYKGTPYARVSEKLVKIASELAPDEFLLRIGRFTHAESKSINDYRKIRVRGPKGRWTTMSQGTSRSLADGKYPMGWVKVRFIENGKEFQKTKEDEKSSNVKIDDRFQQTITVAKPKKPKSETWEPAHLTWSPGNQELTARFEDKKAFGKGKELIPEALQKRLFKKKSVKARVTVEPYGNSLRIIKIEPLGNTS